MQIREIEFDFKLLDQIPADTHHRTKGLHVSQVIYDLAEHMGISRRNDAIPEDKLRILRAMGFAWERIITDVMLKDHRLIDVGEIYRDGLYLTPDKVDESDWVVEEFKFTKRSSRHDIEDDLGDAWLWWTQIKCYCYVLGSNMARLRVCFVNGNYKYDFSDPDAMIVIRAWEAVFTNVELEETWLMILQHAKTMKKKNCTPRK